LPWHTCINLSEEWLQKTKRENRTFLTHLRLNLPKSTFSCPDGLGNWTRLDTASENLRLHKRKNWSQNPVNLGPLFSGTRDAKKGGNVKQAQCPTSDEWELQFYLHSGGMDRIQKCTFSYKTYWAMNLCYLLKYLHTLWRKRIQVQPQCKSDLARDLEWEQGYRLHITYDQS